MNVYLYAPCWNDEAMIPYFLRHYEPVADRMFVFDDGSTDRSVELLRASPKVEVRTFEHRSDAHCFDSRDLWENAWKEHRGEADWIIACNLDEHADHPDLRGYLERCTREGITIVPAAGYNMLSDRFPECAGRLCEHLRRGAPGPNVTKTMIFSARDIETMNYEPGRHRCKPAGRVVAPSRPEVRILHYKHLGFDFVLRRHGELAARLRPGDRSRGMGYHYDRTAKELRAHFDKLEGEAMDVDRDDIRERLLSYGVTFPGLA
jgi:hypothetical protein